jgi:hypothetical protein
VITNFIYRFIYPGALQQKQVNNPLKKLGALYNVQIVNDLFGLVKDLKARNVNYTSEAMPETDA